MVKKIVVYVETAEMLLFYAHESDAGMDICASEDVVIAPGETVLVHTGLKLAIPEGFECQVRPRSGLSLKTPLRIANAPGTIDAGYRDEVCVIMQNTSKDYEILDGTFKALDDVPENHFLVSQKGNKNGWYDIKKGDRIAQLVFAEITKAELQHVHDVKAIGEDRGGGFGSTGTTISE